MSFEEFERFQKAKTEALKKFYNDLWNAASRASSSSAPPPAASKPQEAPRPSRHSTASSSVPPPEPPRQPPPPEPPSEVLPDYAEIMREKESKQLCAHLRYLIERQKKINEQYPPLPSQILSKDGDEECDEDEDDDEALYDLVCLRAIVRKLNGMIHSNTTYVFWHTPEQRISNFRKALYYEALREQAYQAIDKLCNIPQYDNSDDDFDEDTSSEQDSDQHSS